MLLQIISKNNGTVRFVHNNYQKYLFKNNIYITILYEVR